MYKNKYLNSKKKFLELKIEKLLLLNKNSDKYKKLLKKTNMEIKESLTGGNININDRELKKKINNIFKLCENCKQIKNDNNLKKNYSNIIMKEILDFDKKMTLLYSSTINKINSKKIEFNKNDKLLLDNLINQRDLLNREIKDIFEQ